MVFEYGIDIELPDVCCRVEQKREPPNPCGELDFAYLANLWWEATDRLEDLSEEREEPWILGQRRALQPWVTLLDVQAADKESDAKCNRCNDTKDLELCVSENWEEFRQVEIS